MLEPFPISGYVLAGGRSSRMGSDKALIDLAGRPLIDHAVTKLRRICAEVFVLSSNRLHARFAPNIPDIHPHCGPLGGIETALIHSRHDWNLFLPVDMPFVPTTLLWDRVSSLMETPESDPARSPGIRSLIVGERPQPALCLVHRGVAPLITELIAAQELSLVGAFAEVKKRLPAGHMDLPLQSVAAVAGEVPPPVWPLTPAQNAARDLWFLNLNTPAGRRVAAENARALDT